MISTLISVSNIFKHFQIFQKKRRFPSIPYSVTTSTMFLSNSSCLSGHHQDKIFVGNFYLHRLQIFVVDCCRGEFLRSLTRKPSVFGRRQVLVECASPKYRAFRAQRWSGTADSQVISKRACGQKTISRV